ncbi:MAG: gamma-glutamyltransferase [Xanthobacteraceae bacterium]|nr:gamma-glutamyltransferase [Xanthobacteraceae bacterium]PWB63656.1 MAG: gamma-glutamyltransferase [Bradyrhizobiaceae bacterium]
MTRRQWLLALAFSVLASAPASGQAPPVAEVVRPQPVLARNGMVASQEKLATRVGVDILARGGNAVDAAVAVGFALAVTHPQAGNLGGGGFMLVHLAGRNETAAIDYRETAPASTTRDVFLDAAGDADPQKSRDSGLAIGVPGTVAGLALAHARYGSGRFTLAELIAPAIRLAREGIPVEDDLADSLARFQPRLVRWPSSARIFLKPDGVALGEGDRLVQADLADTLAAIAREGQRAFYEGRIGEKIVASVRDAGGLMTREDLRDYRPLVRAPVRGSYRGYEIASMPPPSSGGVHLVQILNILEGFRLETRDAGALHLMIEAMKPAYADRSEFLGDPAFLRVPVAGLTAKPYADALRAEISPDRARPAQEIKPGRPQAFESPNTTHYSVVDRFGNAVSNTTTLNFSYGVGLVAEGTGILLNNELDDFAAKPGVPNAYGLVGGEANAPGPGKRPLSSMTPTILFRDGRVALVTGSPGGSRIITTVLQVITNVIDFRMDLAAAVAAPRIHHQWLPDRVAAERGLAPEIVQALEARGHTVVLGTNSGSANSILVAPDGLVGAADPRHRGTLAAGH